MADERPSALPRDGPALLAFKTANTAPPGRRWDAAGATAILDDPAARLREIADFAELSPSAADADAAAEADAPADAGAPADADAAAEADTPAVAAARAMATAMLASTRADADLNPWLARMHEILADVDDDEPELPVEVSACVLLGDQLVACEVEMLIELGVTHVLNASDTCPWDAELPRTYADAGIAYLELGADDMLGYDMRPHVDASRAFIDAARRGGGRCLVHCQAGVNRSAFIACACELLLHERRAVLGAVARLKSARGLVLLNRSFRRQLLEFARENGLLGECTGDGAGRGVAEAERKRRRPAA